MSFNKDLEIEWLKSEILPKLLKQQKIVEDFKNDDFEKFRILNVDIKVVGAEEAFMLTTCYKVVVQYQLKGLNDKINLFVKKTPELSQEIFDSINFNALFNNEILGYDKIMPALQEFGKMDLKIPKFYYGDLGSNYAIVITDDFSNHQWNMAKELVNISLEHTLLGVKYLAEFHALGFALREQHPQQFQQLTKYLKEPRYNSVVHPKWSIILKEGQKRALNATRKYEPSVDEAFLKTLNNILCNAYDYGKERVKPREPFITLCHGDYLRNNVAFKYDQYGRPLDIMMFDLQTLRVSSPMVDLSIFLSISTFAEVRYKNFSHIFTLYCETLKETYQRLVPQTMPEHFGWNALLHEYIKFLPYSISICAAFLMHLVEPNKGTSQEFLMDKSTVKETIEEARTRGGEAVDRELAHQVKELYELNAANGGNIYDDF